MAPKYEWKKAEKGLYGPGEQPVEIEVPSFGFFVIDGKGDPNGPDFARRVEVLYSLAYGVRMAPKAGLELPGWFEYTVYPLEGVWDLGAPPPASGTFSKEDLVYSVMIRQPDFVDDRAARTVFEAVSRKKNLELLAEARFERSAPERAVQVLHLGSYDSEPATFRRMADFCRKHSLARVGHRHREVYLGDPGKTAPEALKTILRFAVRDDFRCD